MLIKLQEENRKLRLEYEISANNQPGTGANTPLNLLQVESGQSIDEETLSSLDMYNHELIFFTDELFIERN